MKKIITTLSFALICIANQAFKAQTLEESVKATYQQLDTAKTLGQFMAASSACDILTNKYPNEFITNYYSAYAKALISYREKDSKRRDLYLDMANKYYDKVKEIKPNDSNPNNPRIYYLKGAALFYTPKMFGGGGKKAKPFFEQAKPLFPTQDTSSVLIPTWGERQTDEFMKMCDE
ncbi:MAG: hypothetical protein LW701_03485 [Fluviicola sp.]|nr:hypothetical protein [Fluviicola sp.]